VKTLAWQIDGEAPVQTALRMLAWSSTDASSTSPLGRAALSDKKVILG
jgi:hypothetical protein